MKYDFNSALEIFQNLATKTTKYMGLTLEIDDMGSIDWHDFENERWFTFTPYGNDDDAGESVESTWFYNTAEDGVIDHGLVNFPREFPNDKALLQAYYSVIRPLIQKYFKRR